MLSVLVHPRVRQQLELNTVEAVFSKLLQEGSTCDPSQQPHHKATAAAVVEVLSRLAGRMRFSWAQVRVSVPARQ